MDALNQSFAYFRHACDDAPVGQFEHSKLIRFIIGDAFVAFSNELRANGIGADFCDHAHALEAAMYEYVKQSNPDLCELIAAEGFGSKA